MTLLQTLSLAAIFTPVTFAAAASAAHSASKTILPDNVIRCEPGAGCTSETLRGRNYKVLNTPRFTVKVAVTHEGSYTRADVSITNKTGAPLNVTPDDFRVEVLTPKPKVLNYIPPANLVLPPPPQAPPTSVATAPATEPQSSVAAAETAAVPGPASEADVLLVAAKEKAVRQEAAKAAYEHNLAATSIPPNEATSGRVYFQRDKHAHLVNVVLPIAGAVFEFPYAMKK